jgi:predicted nucleic acid-binding protein
MIADANIVVYWFVETPFTRPARALANSHELIAPGFIRLEVANALMKYMRAGVISADGVRDGTAHLDIAISEFVDGVSLVRAAVDLSIEVKHKVYDCLYLALALERQEALATADRRLAEVARRLSIDVQLIEPAS